MFRDIPQNHIVHIDYQIPHTAACWLLSNGQTAVFSLAYQTTLLLFNMNCVTGQTVSTELKQHYIVPRIFSNITGALRFDVGEILKAIPIIVWSFAEENQIRPIVNM